MERKEAIRSAYRMTGENSFYDGMITCSSLVFCCRLNPPFQILRRKWPGQLFPDGFCVFRHTLPSNKVF